MSPSSKIPDNLEEQVKAIISKISGLKPNEISLDAHFVKDLGVDSIQILEIAVGLEKTFGIRVPEERFPSMTTINAVIKEIKPLFDDKRK
mgnify:CR=1 FL=1